MASKVARPPRSRAIPEHAGDVEGPHSATRVVGLRGVPVSIDGITHGDYLKFDEDADGLVPGKAAALDPDHAGDLDGVHGDVEVTGIYGIPIKIDYSLPAIFQDGLPDPGQALQLRFTSIEDPDPYRWENRTPQLPSSTRYIDYDFEFVYGAGGGNQWIRPNKADPLIINLTGLVTGVWENASGTTSADGADSSTVPSFAKTVQEGMILHPPAPYRLESIRVDMLSASGSEWNVGVQIVSSAFTTLATILGTPASRGAAQDLFEESFVGATPYGDGVSFLPMIFQDEWADAHGRMKVRFVA